ncbi:hypothetical protein [Fodinicola feengrottensis]|uniref:hypothetical protein n=1 Tax=Fodinicola feengrottensis TaxID=435914 RepID=UPI002442865D|nr:hypothetical protein [Fodinicola feengrottensis]
MDETLPWFRSLPADQRSWITLVAQAGVAALTEWLRRPDEDPLEATGLVFGAAPRYLARAVTLQQVVAMVKVTVEVVEEQVPWIAAAGEERALKEAVLVFSREVAFAAAQVYARVAETRGAWDARLQALLVDTLLLRAATRAPTCSTAGPPRSAGRTSRRSRSRSAVRPRPTPTRSWTR